MPFGPDSIIDSRIFAADSKEEASPRREAIGQSVEIDAEGNIILQETPEAAAPAPPAPSPQSVEPKSAKREEILVDDVNSESTKAPPIEFTGPNRGSVRSRITQVRSLPKEDAQAVVLLRRGDRVDVLQYQGEYYRVRYLIDGDFPVEGWALQESIQLDAAGQKQIEKLESNRYRPLERESSRAIETQLPTSELPETVKLPGDKAPASDSDDFKKEKRVKENPAMVFSSDEKSRQPKMASLWNWEAGVRLGYSQYREAVTTKTAAGASAKFLDYTFEGFTIEALSGFSYAIRSFLVGIRGHYAFTLFDSEVSDVAGGVSKSSVLAQLHDFGIAGFASHRFNFSKVSIEPELEFGANYQYLSLNSLRDLTLNQTVLFGHGLIYMTAAATPRTYLPYGVILEPELKITVFQSFTEFPTSLLVKTTASTPAEYMRTGKPKTGSMLFSYGGSLIYSLKEAGYENSRLRAFGFVSDFSKKFGDTGNRSGIRTNEAKTKTKIIRAGLGYEYRF